MVAVDFSPRPTRKCPLRRGATRDVRDFTWILNVAPRRVLRGCRSHGLKSTVTFKYHSAINLALFVSGQRRIQNLNPFGWILALFVTVPRFSCSAG
jgi:hypothetical protein